MRVTNYYMMKVHGNTHVVLRERLRIQDESH